MAAFEIGDDVFVREPQRYVDGCTCIVGPIVATRVVGDRTVYTVDGQVGIVGGGHPGIKLDLSAGNIGHRFGIPISQLSGRPGHPGFDEFCRIANSWGYP